MSSTGGNRKNKVYREIHYYVKDTTHSIIIELVGAYESPAEPISYCLYCGKTLVADNLEDFLAGKTTDFLFYHDPDIEHPDSLFLNATIN